VADKCWIQIISITPNSFHSGAAGYSCKLFTVKYVATDHANGISVALSGVNVQLKQLSQLTYFLYIVNLVNYLFTYVFAY
jgi:hypothetical protein